MRVNKMVRRRGPWCDWSNRAEWSAAWEGGRNLDESEAATALSCAKLTPTCPLRPWRRWASIGCPCWPIVSAPCAGSRSSTDRGSAKFARRRSWKAAGSLVPPPIRKGSLIWLVPIDRTVSEQEDGGRRKKYGGRRTEKGGRRQVRQAGRR